MANRQIFGLALGVVLAFSLGVAGAQAPAYHAADKELSVDGATSRLAGDWRSSAPVTISSAQPALPTGATDLGRASSATRLERMLLLLEPSAAQRQALTTELANQQNSTSPEVHRWLTPAAFAGAYANSAADVGAVSAWLASQGFQVAALPAGRGWIEFSGTAGEVEQAFHTQVHLIALSDGGRRALLASSVSVPAALKPVVHGLVSLDGALATAAVTTPQSVSTSVAELAATTSPSRAEALTPQLVAQLTHLDAVHAAGLRGTGQTIAIPARSNVTSGDIAAFRAAFSLPVSPLVVNLNGVDPGLTADRAEAVLAASWAGAAAPEAQIVLAAAATTNSTDGLDLALAAIVDQALAHTAMVGYSACEAALSASHQAFYAALYRQAAAEGIAVIAAAGDGGAAACQAAGSDTPVSSGYGVNALASTPWNTAVGVAAFGSAGPAAGLAALSAWAPGSAAEPAYAGGGGVSRLYGAPAWQAVSTRAMASTVAGAEINSGGLTASQRLLPDLALPTAIDSGVNPGLAFCLSSDKTGTAENGSAAAATPASTATGGCTLVRAGGSSASAAIFSGIAALLAEEYGAQGNLTPNLYALRATSGVYEDVEQGSALLSCVAGSPGCGAEEQIGFAAAAGYDLATGLGAVNAQKLLKAWPQATTGTAAATVTWTTISQTIGTAASLTLTVTVSSATATSTKVPTGTVVFYDVTNSVNIGSATLASGVGTATIATGTLAAGTHDIEAVYSGDTVYATDTSSEIGITVKDSVSVVLTSNLTTTFSGQSVVLTATVTPIVDATNETNPLGMVIFYSGATAIGSSWLAASTGNGSVATLTLSTLPAGIDTVVAVYQGDAYYATATSNSLTIAVQDFTITPASTNSPTNLTIVKGSAGSASYVIAGEGGYDSEVQVVCAVPSQDDMTCTASPQQVTLPGTVTFTVATFASGTTAANQHRELWPRAAGGAALAVVGFFLLPFGRRARIFAGRGARRFMILLLLLVGLGGVGIGCNSVPIASGTGTPLGVATLKITATAYVDNTVVSHSVYLTVNVVAAN
jgi:hypothetical protein